MSERTVPRLSKSKLASVTPRLRTERGRQTDVVDAGALVAKLAFDAEHAEVVTGDGVDIDAGLEVDLVGVDDRGRQRATAWW